MFCPFCFNIGRNCPHMFRTGSLHAFGRCRDTSGGCAVSLHTIMFKLQGMEFDDATPDEFLVFGKLGVLSWTIPCLSPASLLLQTSNVSLPDFVNKSCLPIVSSHWTIPAIRHEADLISLTMSIVCKIQLFMNRFMHITGLTNLRRSQ